MNRFFHPLVFLIAAGLLPSTAVAGRDASSASTPYLKSTPERPAKWIREPGEYDLLLVGDSITRRWNRGNAAKKQFAPWKILVMGHEGERTENLLYRLRNGQLEGVRARAVMLLVGTNNIGHTRDKPEWIASGTRAILDTLREKMPGVRILVMGIFPRGFHAMNPKTGKPDSARQRVEETNRLLAGLANGDDIAFLDIGAKFLDDKGNLDKAVFPDALHPTSQGYAIWLKEARPILADWLKEP